MSEGPQGISLKGSKSSFWGTDKTKLRTHGARGSVIGRDRLWLVTFIWASSFHRTSCIQWEACKVFMDEGGADKVTFWNKVSVLNILFRQKNVGWIKICSSQRWGTYLYSWFIFTRPMYKSRFFFAHTLALNSKIWTIIYLFFSYSQKYGGWFNKKR